MLYGNARRKRLVWLTTIGSTEQDNNLKRQVVLFSVAVNTL
jgi:hypothetical protein